jgi:divalent metal cation (Fe/Co/Zn/Cd) transporter
MKFNVDLHAIIDGKISVKKGHDISHHLKDHLRNELPNLGHVLIHIEPDE